MAMTEVTISQGVLRGAKVKTDSGFEYYEFLGVPYAKPPVGNLRFKSPQPPVPWEGVRDATSIDKNNICNQLDIVKGARQGSEDCLYLNVYTPTLPSSDAKPLPVMFHIHGGGFVFSTGIVKEELGPDYLIENGVVVVTINYRLGVFGFLQLDIPEAAGNMGLKDQVQALRWVRDNIDKFGGDRNNVTIFGISAGSASVEYHMLSPLAKGLFHKAILQSGSSLNHWAINFEPENNILKLLDAMGYSGKRDDNRAIYEYLLSSSASLIVDASYKLIRDSSSNRLSFSFEFVPTVEKDFGDSEAFITENPYRILKDGRFNRVPVIKGFCCKEGYLREYFNSNAARDLIDTKNFIEYWPFEMEPSEKQKWQTKLLTAYSENIQPEDEWDKVTIDFHGDFDIVAGILLSGEIIADFGWPVYLYQFCYEGNINFAKQHFGVQRKGAAHGDDLTYIFKHTVSKIANEKDIAVRSKMTKMWTNFAKTGQCKRHFLDIQYARREFGFDLRVEGITAHGFTESDDMPVHWPTFNKKSPVYVSIDEDITLKTDYEPAKMGIFREIYNKYEK